MERNRRPPGVEEALSSMLWTPYERTPSVSSEDETTTPLPSTQYKPLPCSSKTAAQATFPQLYSSSTFTNSSGSAVTTAPREKHLYPEPIRYSYPGFVPAFIPKSFNNSQSANQLPSYEYIEKERQHHSLSAIGSTGIYFIPPFSTGYATGMVNSFTDDFLQYQVKQTSYNIQPTSVFVAGASSTVHHQTPTTPAPTKAETETSRSISNRFSNDFSSIDLNFPIHSFINTSQTNCTTTMTSTTTTTITTDPHHYYHHKQHHQNNTSENLYFSKQTINDYINDIEDDDDDDDDDEDDDDYNDDNIKNHIATQTTIKTMKQQKLHEQEKTIADLSDEFKVSKPLKHQSYIVQRSRGIEQPERRVSLQHKCCIVDSRVQRANRYGSTVTHFNDRVTNGYNNSIIIHNSDCSNNSITDNNSIDVNELNYNLCQHHTKHNYWINNNNSNSNISYCNNSFRCDNNYLSCNNGSNKCLFNNNSNTSDCSNIQVMRLSVPAAATLEGSRHHTSMYVSTLDTTLSTSSSTTSGSVSVSGINNDSNSVNNENGAIQPSLTIQINQSSNDHQSIIDDHNQIHAKQPQQDVVNHHSSGGISIVNCYRAVPVQIVNNNVSNCNNTVSDTMVQIVNNNKIIKKCDNNDEIEKSHQGHMIDDIIVVANINSNDCAIDSEIIQMDITPTRNIGNNLERTYISTEAQTDSLQEPNTARQPFKLSNNTIIQSQSPSQTTAISVITADTSHNNNNDNPITDVQMTREQRRRDRRERRLARNARQQHLHPPASLRSGFEILPDILHSHVPPPYTALPITSPQVPSAVPSVLVPPIITPLPIVGTTDDGRYAFPLPIIRRSPSERSGKGCCGQWFAGPPLRAVIAVVALGGVACALGGAALGATGLAGPPTSHLTAALLMIGVGVILVTVSGAAWRMTAPGAPQCLGLGSGGDLGRCGRRPCSGRAPHGLLYPEFQHRPPPPSYQASMQEYRLRLLLLDRDRQAGVVRGASPPPTYRSNAGSLLRAPLSARCNATTGGPGSEYSLPPSYRQQQLNQLQQQHQTINHTNPIHTSSSSEDILNDTMHSNEQNESPSCISTETVIISTEQQLHQQKEQEQQLKQQQQLQMQQNSIICDTSLHLDTINANTQHNVFVDVVNNMKISQLSSNNSGSKNNNEINCNNNSHDSVSSCNNNVNDTIEQTDLVTIVTISGCSTASSSSDTSSSGEMDILAHL